MRDKGKFCFVNLKHVCLFTENEKIRIAKKKKKNLPNNNFISVVLNGLEENLAIK